MTIHEGVDLHKRVERYEAAVDELRAAHQDIKDVLTEHVIFERWQHIGAELGFVGNEQPSPQDHQQQNGSLHQQVPEMSGSWSS